MNASAHKVQVKEKRLLQLYSLWHETHQGSVQKKCLSLLGEILSVDPSFSMRQEFQAAF